MCLLSNTLYCRQAGDRILFRAAMPQDCRYCVREKSLLLTKRASSASIPRATVLFRRSGGGLELLSPFLYTFRVSSKKNALRGEAERVVNTCYVFRLRVFNRLISRVYNEALSARALTVSQFNILTVIVRGEPVAPHQISAVLQIEKSSLSRNIDLMRRNGWIITKNTGRRSLISVTEKGRHVYKNALPFWKDAQQKALKLAGEEIFQQIT